MPDYHPNGMLRSEMMAAASALARSPQPLFTIVSELQRHQRWRRAYATMAATGMSDADIRRRLAVVGMGEGPEEA